jgi:formate hydrogenlyase subunit 6/NADH:ubiquinone oxidoreductase subunit I
VVNKSRSHGVDYTVLVVVVAVVVVLVLVVKLQFKRTVTTRLVAEQGALPRKHVSWIAMAQSSVALDGLIRLAVCTYCGLCCLAHWRVANYIRAAAARNQPPYDAG